MSEKTFSNIYTMFIEMYDHCCTLEEPVILCQDNPRELKLGFQIYDRNQSHIRDKLFLIPLNKLRQENSFPMHCLDDRKKFMDMEYFKDFVERIRPYLRITEWKSGEVEGLTIFFGCCD